MRQRDALGRIVPNTTEIGGKTMRVCSGPSHEVPILLPDTDKYFYMRKSGKHAGLRVTQCRLCRAWIHGMEPGQFGLVPLHLVKPFFIEGVNRVGKMEFCRRAGLTQRNLYAIMQDQRGQVKKSTVRRVMLEVISMRRKGEFRHVDSIKHGAAMRGRNEKTVKTSSDMYSSIEEKKQARAIDAERKRKERAALTPEKKTEILQKDRARKRAKCARERLAKTGGATT